jgi:hypothetical protein
MERRRRLSTPILERHGKIGPFFFKEAWLMLTIFIATGCGLLIVGSFVYIPPVTLIGSLSAILLVLSLARSLFIKKIDSPWYIHAWMAHAFFSPQRILAHPFPFQGEKIDFLPRTKNREKPVSQLPSKKLSDD